MKEPIFNFKNEASNVFEETKEVVDNLEFEKQKEELEIFKVEIEKEIAGVRESILEVCSDTVLDEAVAE